MGKGSVHFHAAQCEVPLLYIRPNALYSVSSANALSTLTDPWRGALIRVKGTSLNAALLQGRSISPGDLELSMTQHAC